MLENKSAVTEETLTEQQQVLMESVDTLSKRICEQTLQKCQKDFKEAAKQAAKLLEPFICRMSVNEAHDLLNNLFGMSCCGVYEQTDNGKRVPAAYVKSECNAALKTFMQKIDDLQMNVGNLQDQIDRLYNQMDN